MKGYCTLEDVRRALRKSDLPGDLSQDKQIAVDAITAQTEWLEKTLKRHWYAETGDAILDEATAIDVPTGPKSRDDEHDIPTGGAHLAGNAPAPKKSQGDYTRILLDRRDADSLEQLHVRTADGTFEDWVNSADYTEGSWPPAGEDYYLRVNNDGWSYLYLDMTNFLEEGEDDEYVLDSFANAVYLEWSYGHAGLPQTARNAVALRAGARFAEEATIQIPDNATVYNVETKAEQMRNRAEELLEAYR